MFSRLELDVSLGTSIGRMGAQCVGQGAKKPLCAAYEVRMQLSRNPMGGMASCCCRTAPRCHSSSVWTVWPDGDDEQVPNTLRGSSRHCGMGRAKVSVALWLVNSTVRCGVPRLQFAPRYPMRGMASFCRRIKVVRTASNRDEKSSPATPAEVARGASTFPCRGRCGSCGVRRSHWKDLVFHCRHRHNAPRSLHKSR